MHYIITLMPFVQRLLEKERSPSEQRIWICVLEDISEHYPQAGNNHVQEFPPFSVYGSTHPYTDIRQYSIYGLGTVVGKYTQALQPMISTPVLELMDIIQHPFARLRRRSGHRKCSFSTWQNNLPISRQN